jgi:hypothetical protein
MFALGLVLAVAIPALAQKPSPGQPGGNPGFQLRNNSPNVVNNVYASPSSQSDWGRDLLGSNEVIQAGATRDFQLAPGDCMYDIRVLYQGSGGEVGGAEERRHVNVCTETAITLPMVAQQLR